MNLKPALESGQDLRDLPTYTVPEAAVFLGIPPRTLLYWVSGSNPILKPSGSIGGMALLSFRDVAEAYVIELLRSLYGFNLKLLHGVVDNARKETRQPRPFLQSDLYVVFNKLVIKQPARGKRSTYAVDITSNRNLVLPQLIEMVGTRVLQDKRKDPYLIYPWRLANPEDKMRPVSMDPQVMSGRLVIAGTRIPVRMLLAMRNRGKEVDQIAKSYDLPTWKVESALEHIERPIQKKVA